MPHCWASGLLPHASRPQRRQEAPGLPYREAHPWAHQRAHRPEPRPGIVIHDGVLLFISWYSRWDQHQVLIDAITNSGPREDSTRVGSAGVVRRQAVDVSPFRRVNVALYLMTTGARESSFRNIKTISECLADEIINAARGSSNSYAIKKKDEIERVAKANR